MMLTPRMRRVMVPSRLPSHTESTSTCLSEKAVMAPPSCLRACNLRIMFRELGSAPDSLSLLSNILSVVAPEIARPSILILRGTAFPPPPQHSHRRAHRMMYLAILRSILSLTCPSLIVSDLWTQSGVRLSLSMTARKCRPADPAEMLG